MAATMERNGGCGMVREWGSCGAFSPRNMSEGLMGWVRLLLLLLLLQASVGSFSFGG
jgi:hypothetical protein